jgi:2-polyprenyl-6-hydroxyphenyl methylase/3-demethylubiquinone-9 3-methyltransferase
MGSTGMQDPRHRSQNRPDGGTWDYGSHESFFDYYAAESLSPRTVERYASIRDVVLRVYGGRNVLAGPLEVLDVGCGAGTQCLMWAELGHSVHGLDVNEPLLNLGRQRAAEQGREIDFRLGSAVKLPWSDESMDACLVPELLEHVAEWKSCLLEFTRVLRPGGVLFLSTTNKLCPRQQEYNLPGYSWYPGFIKRRCERLAATTRPNLAGYAKYPAVNWFSFYSLRNVLASAGFNSLDRFDVMDLSTKGWLARTLVTAIRSIPPLRFLAHMVTSSTVVVAVKDR